ncbi:hypothetical protein ABPG77_009028 [Micractinium sp. CCAP 211/92]
MSSLVWLPRASSKAFRQLRPRQQENGVQPAVSEQASAGVPPEPQQPAPAAQADPRLAEGLAQLKASDTGSVLECTGTGGGSLSAILAAAQAGQLTAPDALRQLRALCDHAISTSWRAGQRAVAQAASELLDEGNELLAELDEGPAAAGGAALPTTAREESEEPAVARPQLPAETFFLAPEQVRECLTLNIDSSILMAAQPPRRTGGWPLGRKRKGEGTGSAALGKRKTGGRHFNPWTPELQQQLATVLRLALRSQEPGSARLPKEEVAQLSPALASLAGHLHSSAAGEQLQSMGTTLGNVVSMLQVGAFTDFEEMLNDVREECHATVEAYLSMQNVEVRRGRLIAQIESFVNTLGTAIETLLIQIRADHRAAVEAAGGVEEDSDDEDDFYPASLPDSILANKEPFKGGDWRKTPYIPRPYVRLTEYDIVEPEMRDIILRKLSTKKHGGCNGNHCKSRKELGCYSVVREGFDTRCSCLARNTECDAHCACHGSSDCLNRAVSARNTLQLGTDAEEVDSWGMDCYVRRNILDAVLDCGAFGHWTPPDYHALKAAGPVEYAALRAATTGNSGGTAASPAAAVLPKAPTAAAAQQQALAVAAKQQGEQAEGLPGTPLSAKRNGSDEVGECEDTAAVVAPLQSPPPTPAQIRVETRVAEWLERELLPAINRQGDKGWDLLAALADVKQRARDAGNEESAKAAEAVEQRLKDVGYNYFRLHPKGVGLVCKRKGGLPPLTFVEEYLGEIHTPWRWFEIQDAVKKITGDELPDFYNIVLERPKDDPDGYDVLFIDAAAKGALASRMSHSCTPNCQAIVMACNGRLTIALYTLRQVYEGEELTFDYSSVTESEKEFREAICLCSTRNCRGSYLYFTGSRAFQQVMAEQHNFLHRQVIITRAGSEPLTQDDLDRIKRHGLGDSALGSVEHGDRAPDWLIKWTSLICEFIEEEEAHLKEDLLNHPQGIYNEVTATAEAKGVVANRLQNVVITLDKVKMVLRAPNQAQGPCLRLLSDEEAAEYLWDGPRSVARRILRGCIQALAPIEVADTFAAANADEELQWAARQHAGELPAGLAKLCTTVLQPSAGTFEDARQLLMEVYQQVRALDVACGGGLTAVADVLLLYAATLHWFTCERGYRGVTSSPVPLNIEDLTLDRAQPATDGQTNGGEPGGRLASRPGSGHDLPSALGGGASESEGLSNLSNLRKVYRPLYIWGQLSGWFKQTVNDPTASLSAERRGTISLPDIESSFSGGRARYTIKDRTDLIEQLEKRPDAMWRTGTIWSFKNDLKVYGSPALDAVWDCATGKKPASAAADPLAGVLAELRNAVVPPRLQVAGGGGKVARGKNK